jgi:ubiquinone/menaquinone biosynthesis C-methylase UbiE
LPFPEGSFNKVAALHSIYFWPSLEEGLRELRRVLTPTGRAVIAVRMQHTDAPRFDPSHYGLAEADLSAVANTAGRVGFTKMIVERQAELDRQTMAAVVAYG